MDDEDLAGLVARARLGDEDAIRHLLDHFEEDLRTIVRARLPRALRARFDSTDFVQAVWQSFLTPKDPPPIQFENSAHLRGFLASVARNKVYEEYHRLTRTKKYDLNREEPLYVRRGNRDLPREVASHDPTPSQDAQAQDCLAQLLEGRSPQEARIIELRRSGMSFGEIAAETGIGERTVRRVIEAAQKRMEDRRWQ